MKTHSEDEKEKRKIEVILFDEWLTAPSGLTMVGKVLGEAESIKKSARMKTDKQS